MKKARIQRCTAREISFSEGKAAHAQFKDVDMRSADLSHSDFSFALFENVDMNGVDLTGACFLILPPNNLIGLTKDQLESAFTEADIDADVLKALSPYQVEFEMGRLWQEWRRRRGFSVIY